MRTISLFALASGLLLSIPASSAVGSRPSSFHQGQHVAAIVEDCIRLRMPALWLQDGVVDVAAAAKAQAAGIFTVMDRCIYRDRAALAMRCPRMSETTAVRRSCQDCGDERGAGVITGCFTRT